MPKEYDISNIEIRSEEVQEILGSTPRWIIRAGISVVLGIVLAILLASWFFKYPDLITSQISLITKSPPASLKAKRNGKITHLFYKEGDTIEKKSVVAIVENPANYKDVFLVKSILDTLVDIKSFDDIDGLILGDLQSGYSSFRRLLNIYNSFEGLAYFDAKIQAVKQQQEDYNLYYDRLWKKRILQEKDLHLAEKQFKRDEKLFQSGVYSKLEYEKAEKKYLQEQLTFENLRSSLANTQMQINQLNQQVLDLQLQQSKEANQHKIVIEEALENLKSQIIQWEQNYLIITPISGRITYTKIWSENQNVKAGEIVATIIPSGTIDIIGKVNIPAIGAGKVRVGQNVNIKLDNYPHMEFGLLRGNIKSISLVPTQTPQGNIYSAEIDIADNLKTNYGKELKFSQEMSGTAEIVTDDVRLLERFLNPLRSLWKKNIE